MNDNTNRPYADAGAAARRILEIAKEVETLDGRIFTVLISGPFVLRDSGSPAEYAAGLQLLIQRKQVILNESEAYIRLPGDHYNISRPRTTENPITDEELDTNIRQLRPFFKKVSEIES